MKPLISICAALLGATAVALSVWFGGGDAPSSSTSAQASAADLECAPVELCRPVVRVDAQGEPVDGGVAGAGTVIWIDPPSQTVGVGDEVVVEVRIRDVPERQLGAYDVEIQYEPTVLTFATVSNGPFLGSTGRDVLCQPSPLFGEGTVRYGCNTPGFGPPDGPAGPTGDGLLVTFRFNTSCAGSSIIHITENSGISDPEASRPLMEFTTEDGSATVTGGDVCPTPTIGPTVTPGGATSTPTPTPPQETPEPTATQEGPVGSPTPTVTGTPPTSTPTPTWTQVPTWTPQPTWTPPPTWTPDTGPATPTNTPVPPIALGDTGCDGEVGPEDATLILQWWAGLLNELPCPEAGDADGNGATHLTDATVILQFSTGMVASLPPE